MEWEFLIIILGLLAYLALDRYWNYKEYISDNGEDGEGK